MYGMPPSESFAGSLAYENEYTITQNTFPRITHSLMKRSIRNGILQKPKLHMQYST